MHFNFIRTVASKYDSKSLKFTITYDCFVPSIRSTLMPIDLVVVHLLFKLLPESMYVG